MNSPHYTTHQRTTRAASCKHTESGAPKREPFRYIYEERGTPDLQKGDAVIITDQHSAFFDKTGVVDTVLTVKKYLVRFAWSPGAIHPFKRSQLAKVERKGAPSALLVIDMPVAKAKSAPKRPDRFICEWKTVDLPSDIPRRFIEHKNRTMKKKPITQPVLLLPAVCESTRKEQARAKFEAFMQLCAVEYKQEEMFVQSLDMPAIAKKQGKVQRSAKTRPQTKAQPKPAKRPPFSTAPKLRIRSYAA